MAASWPPTASASSATSRRCGSGRTDLVAHRDPAGRHDRHPQSASPFERGTETGPAEEVFEVLAGVAVPHGVDGHRTEPQVAADQVGKGNAAGPDVAAQGAGGATGGV